MFTITEVKTERGTLQYRRETLTGLSCRISSERIKRRIDLPQTMVYNPGNCPFCSENVATMTPLFPDGTRIFQGESVTFPNLYPFGAWHTVTVITRTHDVREFTHRQLLDAFSAQVTSLRGHDGFPSINWNFLPSAGASLAHPHLQGLVDPEPSFLATSYLTGSESYRREHGRCYGMDLRALEAGSPRYLFGDEILWTAHAVPLGEREVRGILPVSQLSEFEPLLDTFIDGLARILDLYRRLGTHAFNLSLFFDREGHDHGFSAFCTVIARINPNDQCMSDSSFMERLHLQPVILTAPEELARMYREKMGT
jgi:galactose-1-phosphate uridylyltransferase